MQSSQHNPVNMLPDHNVIPKIDVWWSKCPREQLQWIIEIRSIM